MNLRNWGIIFFMPLLLGCDKSPIKPETTDHLPKKIIETYKEAYQLPALVGGVIENNQTDISVSGVRKNGTTNKVNEEDLFFIGSNAKAMSATMIATLVEEKLLSWNSSISNIFPELKDIIPVLYHDVTLTQLLNHHGGIDPNEDVEELLLIPSFSGSIIERRYQFVQWILNQSNGTMIGTYQYSNAGYVIAAAMAEKVTRQTWEELMTSRLFHPLGISGCFDWPAEKGRNEPWGHTFENGEYVPFNPDSTLQFPELLNPSGNISLSMRDYLKFIQLHIDGLNDNTHFLRKGTFDILHTPVDYYSLGWAEAVDPDTGIPLAFHEGSDGTFDACIIIKPSLHKGAAVFTNCASEKSSEAIFLACIELIEMER